MLHQSEIAPKKTKTMVNRITSRRLLDISDWEHRR
jgi:hypothetical protein